jgi:shikimate kinase
MTAASHLAFRRLIFLLGFMGCGKTTVGRLLAKRLAWQFVDLDELIEARAGRSIVQIFAEEGEPTFRSIEHELLTETLAAAADRLPRVIALGGGTFAQIQNFALIQAEGGLTIWLRCPISDLRRRCSRITNRPLFRDEASFKELYCRRLPYYEKADIVIDSEGLKPGDVVKKIVELGFFR